ncbi:MAG TPA: CopY family transcriptional regulator [Planctomycetaceae bacterium]|nr:CopY family transcriptional regulator [Planctomycetaceae bacterium]|tara:strand:+ start:12 stop:395 length:384 start_codon:yes stop_codon:yes gene_type:complete
MARPKAAELTERELEIMRVFWDEGPMTAQQVRDRFQDRGTDLAYTTVATLIRILTEKGFLQQTNEERPFVYQPIRSFEEVSSRLVDLLLRQVFDGSREKLLVSLFGQQKITKKERSALQDILQEKKA